MAALNPAYQLLEERMFVAIARFPEVPTEREQEFEAWFAWSNDQLRQIDGLQGRRLLRAADGTYTALVEHRNAETYAAMHTTEVASQVHARLGEVILGDPRATQYEVVINLAQPGSCCGGGGGHEGQGGHDRATAGVGAELMAAGGCCHGA
jgi:heme-degrading monooxygenase HmoA